MTKDISLVKSNLIKMKYILAIIFLFVSYNSANAENGLIFYLEAAYQNNPKLNAERKNFKA